MRRRPTRPISFELARVLGREVLAAGPHVAWSRAIFSTARTEIIPFTLIFLLAMSFGAARVTPAEPDKGAAAPSANGSQTLLADLHHDDLLPWERDAAAQNSHQGNGLESDALHSDAQEGNAVEGNAAAIVDTPEVSGENEQAARDEPQGPPHPMVMVIRDVLVSKAFANKDFVKTSSKEDVAALQDYYATSNAAPVWVDEKGLTTKARALAVEMARANEWGLEEVDFSLPDADFMPADEKAQALAEVRIDLAVLKYARLAQVGRSVPGKIDPLFDQSPSLPEAMTVMAEMRATQAPELYLRALHPNHEQFSRLRTALAAARAAEEPNETDIKRLIMNMERWRWMPRELGGLHVWLNTPAFMLYLVKDGKTLYTDKTLVGIQKYATPIFSADLETIVFNPHWVAPPSVLRDKLWPALKRKNYSVVTGNKLRVSYKGRGIDPSKIDWKRNNIHNFVFTQRAGPTNVLGKAKFLYPNKHVVYMHDTLPKTRGKFKRDYRAYGNGCVRMEHPKDFATLLLEEDQQFPKSDVDRLWKKGVNKSVTLKTLTPVHTTYFTAIVDEDGKVQTFKDLYGLDRKHAKALFGTSKGFIPAPRKRKPKPKKRGGNVASAGGNGLMNGFGLFGN